MKKSDLRKESDSARELVRKRAIEMIKGGKMKKEVAELLGVHPNSITNWVKKYKGEGVKGLKSSKRGAKSENMKLLSTKQEHFIQNAIIDKMPQQLKFPYALWTRKAVKELIEREFGIQIAINTTGDYLRKWGFSPQKPKKKAYEQRPAEVKKWLEESYPAIVKKAKQENAVIHWGDETGVRNTNYHGRSYAPKGKTPVKMGMAKRFSVNMISTVTNQGQVEFMIYTDKMNSQRLIKFLELLIEGKKRKVYLILDNLRVHHSKLVKEWVEKHKNRIDLFYLPSYSPEKNPDEYLNCDLKQGMSAIPAPKKQSTLEENVQNHMEMLVANSQRVKKYFNHPEIAYAS